MKKMEKIGVTLLLIAIVLQTGFMNIVAEVKPQAEERIMYLDYTYTGGDSDGSLDKPFTAMYMALNEIGTREGYTIKFLSNVNDIGITYVGHIKDITFDLNGHQWKQTSEIPIFKDGSINKSITLMDSTGNGELIVNDMPGESIIAESSDVYLRNIEIKSKDASKIISAENIVLENSTITSEETPAYSCYRSLEASNRIVLNNSSVKRNSRGTRASLLEAKDVSMVDSKLQGEGTGLHGIIADQIDINNSQIDLKGRNATCVTSYNKESASVTIDGEKTLLQIDGTAAWAITNIGSIVMKDGTIRAGSENIKSSTGNLISVDDGRFVMSGGTLFVNTLTENFGSPALTGSGADITITKDAQIQSNDIGISGDNIDIKGNAQIKTDGRSITNPDAQVTLSENAIVWSKNGVAITTSSLTMKGGVVGTGNRADDTAVIARNGVTFDGGIILGKADNGTLGIDYSWTVKGAQTLPFDAEVYENRELTITKGSSLSIAPSKTLQNNGSINVYGALNHDRAGFGKITGRGGIFDQEADLKVKLMDQKGNVITKVEYGSSITIEASIQAKTTRQRDTGSYAHFYLDAKEQYPLGKAKVVNENGTLKARFTTTVLGENAVWNEGKNEIVIKVDGIVEGSILPTTRTVYVDVFKTAPNIKTQTLKHGVINTKYDEKLDATGSEPITWSLQSGELPKGLRLQGDRIVGVPEKIETTTFTLIAKNGMLPISSKTYTLTIDKQIVPVNVMKPSNFDQAIDKTKDLRIGFDKEMAKIKAIRLNGKEISWNVKSPENYTLYGWEGYTKTLGKVEAGSTYVTLYKEFLQTLPDGNYILEVDFEDATTKGYASASFKLKEGAPSTGDTTNTAYLFLLMMGSMMVAGYLCRKRQGTKQEA